jgi:DNA-binding transcriptional LysR family regulator
MDLKHLQTFITLSEIRNFTKTAEYLNYAQSNVTTQIQQLEKELDVRLFERIGKSVTLTSAGHELIPYAKKMLNLSRDLKENFSSKDNGRIVIGASESVCIYRLPDIIKSFQIKYPTVEIFLYVLDTSDFVSLLSDNTIDIAYVLDTPISHSSIETALKINETICAFSAPEQPLAKKSNVSISDFANQRLILTGKDCCYRKMFERDLSEFSITPKIVLETSSLQVIKQAVLSGLGICVLPQLAVQKELDKKELVKINYDTDYKIESQLIYHKDKWISQNLSNFIKLAKEFV